MATQQIGLVAHLGKKQAEGLVNLLVEAFRARNISVIVESRTATLLPEGSVEAASLSEIGQRCGMLVVLGGDGTLLRAVHDMGEYLCPVFGINIGSLGFLTCVGSQAYMKAVEAICSGEFVLSARSLLSVVVERKGEVVSESVALNDAVISRGGHSRLIKLDTAIDGIELTRYNADGLIVATPTGSTAYSLSSGGPVIMPEAGVFVITPICPHVLTNRSVVVSDSSEITVRPIRCKEEVALAVDGQEPVKIREGDLIRIRKSSLKLPLAMLPKLSFSEVLRGKLKWSGSAL